MNTRFHIDERPLSRKELKEATAVACRGFFDDPFFIYLLPDDKMRERGLKLFFGAGIKHIGPNGRIVTVRDENNTIVSVAAWMPPRAYPQSIWTQLKQTPSGLRALYRRPKAMKDGNRYLVANAKVHPKEPHLYLYLLVADPSIQRTGAGTMLLEQGLSTADEQGVGSYLETQKESNLAYYQRFGYELANTLRPVEGGPPLYTMWRKPR